MPAYGRRAEVFKPDRIMSNFYGIFRKVEKDGRSILDGLTLELQRWALRSLLSSWFNLASSWQDAALTSDPPLILLHVYLIKFSLLPQHTQHNQLDIIFSYMIKFQNLRNRLLDSLTSLIREHLAGCSILKRFDGFPALSQTDTGWSYRWCQQNFLTTFIVSNYH